MTDPHFLLHRIWLSRTQPSVSEISANLDGVITALKVNCSYCYGVKVCGGERCNYTVSTKQRMNIYAMNIVFKTKILNLKRSRD